MGLKESWGQTWEGLGPQQEGKQRRPGAYFPVPQAGGQGRRLGEGGRKSPLGQVTPRGWVGAGRAMESRSELLGHLRARCCPASQEPGSPAR